MEGEKIFGSQNYFNLILKRECKGAVCRECEADCLADLVPPPGRQPGGGGVMCGAAAAARGPGQRVAAFSFYGESDTGYWRGIRGNLDLLQVTSPRCSADCGTEGCLYRSSTPAG